MSSFFTWHWYGCGRQCVCEFTWCYCSLVRVRTLYNAFYTLILLYTQSDCNVVVVVIILVVIPFSSYSIHVDTTTTMSTVGFPSPYTKYSRVRILLSSITMLILSLHSLLCVWQRHRATKRRRTSASQQHKNLTRETVEWEWNHDDKFLNVIHRRVDCGAAAAALL